MRLVGNVLVVLLAFSCMFLGVAESREAGKESEAQEMLERTDNILPNVTARSAVVMEARTGRVLYSRNMKARRFPASTTKAMTLIVALEKGNMDDVVTVSRRAAGTEGSTLWLEEGKKVRFGDLLYGIIMRSGNDGTVAVAEHVAGNVDAFARMMTEKAREIGAADTYFVNPHGLPDERHYTTAYDMALIASYGYRNPVFVDIVKTKEKTIPWGGDPADFWRNENQMLWLYDGANGVKTGYTDAAGRCLVAGAERDGIQLVAVVLDSIYMWNDSIAMLDYGFAHVKPLRMVNGGESFGNLSVLSGRRRQVPVRTASDIMVPVGDDGDGGYSKVVDLPKALHAPVEAGDVVGTVRVMYDGREVGSTDLVATESVEVKSFFVTLYQLAKKYHVV